MMKILKYWLMILWLALALPVTAANLPNYYPKGFSSGGIIKSTGLSAEGESEGEGQLSWEELSL